jgi:hypothetical protein
MILSYVQDATGARFLEQCNEDNLHTRERVRREASLWLRTASIPTLKAELRTKPAMPCKFYVRTVK